MPDTPHHDARHDSPHDTYTSPLASRNASPEMLRLWSPRHKFNTWRRIWLAIAEAQHEVTKGRVGGPLVTEAQVEALRAVVARDITDAEMDRAAQLERDLRHDVMAHVHCLGESCPEAKSIIHLGCTSQDVVCNADGSIIDDALQLTMIKIARAIDALGAFARTHAALPALGFTHYQPAQPVTMGRRATGWAYELSLAHDWCASAFGQVMPRGLKGATGTQASFLGLFDNDGDAVDALEAEFVARFQGADDIDVHPLSTQTYPRVTDAMVLSGLAAVAAVLHKIATDIRLLSNRKELDEPFGDKQIGSSAMPYKRNPMKCERICGLTRFVMNLVGNAYDTAATQWLERTLDDSSNRRLSLPEAFLALDGALDLTHQVAHGLVVHEAMVRRNLMAELPFLATEHILMEAVKAGGDRQEYHEIIRRHAQEAGLRVKQHGEDNDLLERLQRDPAFGPPALKHALDWSGLMDPMRYVGRSVEQTERFLAEVIEPMREQYGDDLEALGGSDRGV